MACDADREISSRWERKLRRFQGKKAEMHEMQNKTDGFFTMREGRRERKYKIESRGAVVASARGGEATQAAITYTATAATKGKQAVHDWILDSWMRFF